VELAELDLLRAEHERSRERLDRALQQLKSIDSIYTWRVEVGLARLEAAVGDASKGLEHANRASGLLEAQRDRLPAGADQTGVLQALQTVRQLQERLGRT
jgi:phage-related tail protein